MGNSPREKEAQYLKELRQRRLAEEQARKKRENKILLCIVCGILALAFIGGLIAYFATRPEKSPYDKMSNKVRMTVSYTDKNGVSQTGTITVLLDPEAAPITVNNFKKLVSEGFYNGLTFHRIYSGFMIQGGDPEGTGAGGSSETIKGEFKANGYNNPISHTRGVISMARSQSYNSASSQFFIMHADNSASLDGNYAAFGRVIEGMDTVDGIAETPVAYAPGSIDSKPTSPVNPVTILKMEFVD